MKSGATEDHDPMKPTFFTSFIRQLYRRNDQGSSVIVITAICVLLILFVLLHFRSPLWQISYFRDQAVHNFLSDIEQKDQFSIEKLWELRDALGAVVTYNEEYLHPQSILEFKQIPLQTVKLFEYASKDLRSEEHLALPEDKTAFFKTNASETVIFSNQQVIVVYDESQRFIRMMTVLPFEEMKEHNGMIDYGELKQDLSDRLWITSTVIRVSPKFSFDSL